MKNFILLITMFFVFSCGNKKVLHLPEIDHSEITDIKDVSVAYLFYDETQIDSVELNRKNLISSTNWLINVDKRLTLGQVIPHIKFLQEKKGNSSHKNEKAKNYFTCNDTSRKNLGFIEFTDVVYRRETIKEFNKNSNNKELTDQEIYINVISSDSIPIWFNSGKCVTVHYSKKDELLNGIKSDLWHKGNVIIHIGYSKDLSFQNYIELKYILSSFSLGHAIISNQEFISN